MGWTLSCTSVQFEGSLKRNKNSSESAPVSVHGSRRRRTLYWFILCAKERCKNTLRGGVTLFRAAFGHAWVPPPSIFDDRLVSPPISDEHLMSPPHFQKYIFLKSVYTFRYIFTLPKKVWCFLSMRSFVIEYLLFEWLKVQINWFGWLKPWN